MKEELQKLVGELTKEINRLSERDGCEFYAGRVSGLRYYRDKLVFILGKEYNNVKEVKEKRAE